MTNEYYMKINNAKHRMLTKLKLLLYLIINYNFVLDIKKITIIGEISKCDNCLCNVPTYLFFYYCVLNGKMFTKIYYSSS